MQDLDLWRLGHVSVMSVVQYLDAIPDLYIVSKVCKSWKKAVLEFGSMRRVRLKNVAAIDDKWIALMEVLKRNGNLKEIVMEHCSFPSKGFSSISVFCGAYGLRTLEIHSCQNIQESKVSALIYAHRNSIERFVWLGDSQKIFCRGIVSKCLINSRSTSEERYSHLEIFDFPKLHCGEQFCTLSYFRNSPLKILNLPFIKINTDDFLMLGSVFDTLEELSIYLRHSQRESRFEFPFCPKLWSLELSECSFKHSCISFNLPCLTRLSLRAADVSSVEGSFPKLEYVDMSWTMLPSKIIAKLFSESNCTNLVMGQFDGSLIDEDALEVVERVAKNAKLYVHSCRSIPITVRKKMRLTSES
jgi:hypothetical protein